MGIVVRDDIVDYSVILRPGIHDTKVRTRIVCFEPNDRVIDVRSDIKINDSITIESINIHYSVKEEAIPDLLLRYGATVYSKQGFESDWLLGRYFYHIFKDALPALVAERLSEQTYDRQQAVISCLREIMKKDGLIMGNYHIWFKKNS